MCVPPGARTDVVKILLTLCLAAMFGGLSLIFSLGFVHAGSDLEMDFLPDPRIAHVALWLCSIPMVGFACLSAWAIRSAFLQIMRPKTEWEIKEEPDLADLIDGRFDLARLTGAGWLLSLLSAAIPVILFSVMLGEPDIAPERRALLIFGYPIMAMATLFVRGRWVLHRIGIRVVEPDKYVQTAANDKPQPSWSEHFG